MSSDEVYFAQHLASNDSRVRDRAMKKMRLWLLIRSRADKSDFSMEGMLKLWKGLFFCMWMADKPLVQEELADSIGGLVNGFASASEAQNFVGAFFVTMGRNHDHIDKFRIDKFLMFTRRIFRSSLEYLGLRGWDRRNVWAYISLLRETVLTSKQNSREMALGFRLHFFDIFLEELARAGAGHLPRKRAHNFLEPFYEILTYCKSPMIVEGVRDKIFFELVRLNSRMLQEQLDAALEHEKLARAAYKRKLKSFPFIDGEAEEFDASALDVEDEEESDDDEGDVIERKIRSFEDQEAALKKKKTTLADESGSESDEYDDYDDDEEEEEEDDYDYNADDGGDAELSLLPIDFDMAAVRTSLVEFSRVEGIKAFNRKAIENIIKKIIDLENGVDPFAVKTDDSGSDIELTDAELKMAERRLRLLQKQCADEAEKCLIPERDWRNGGNGDDDFEMEGGEGDIEEFEKIFVGGNTSQENRKPTSKKASKKAKKRAAGADTLSDSESEHIGGIEMEIDEMNSRKSPKSRKRKASSVKSGAIPESKSSDQKKGHKDFGAVNVQDRAKHSKQKSPSSRKNIRT